MLAVTNFPPLQVADFMSEVLVLGVETGEGEVALIQADREVPLGKTDELKSGETKIRYRILFPASPLYSKI